MIKPIFKPFLLSIIVLMSTCFSSCDPNDGPVIPGIVGTWQLSFDQIGPIGGFAVDKYEFNIDGRGYYGYYDRFNIWRNIPFVWRTYASYGANVIVIDYLDGNPPVQSYYDFDGGYLIFWTDNPNFYNGYIRVPI